MTTERVEHMAGGEGHALIKRLLDEKCMLRLLWNRDVLLVTMNTITKVKLIISFPERESTVTMVHSAW